MAGRLIMIIDDDLPFLDVMSQVLQGEGYQPRLCAEASRAVAQMRFEQPDLVLLDMRFAHQNLGLEILDALRQDPQLSHIPVIACSVEEQVLAQHAALLSQLGCAPLVKPFDLDELLELIVQLLRSP